MIHRVRPWVVSTPVALLLSLVLAAEATAGSWGTPVRVAGGAFADGLATLANGTAIAVFEKCVGGGFCTNAVLLKRSTDGGQSWGPSVLVAGDDADEAATSGRGTNVDLVWRGSEGVEYSRSHDSGGSFSPPILISHSGDSPTVATGVGGLVAVSWGSLNPTTITYQINIRVSTNGGATFGPKTSWATLDDRWSRLAVGEGAAYVTYLNLSGTPVVRHSLDAGVTWSSTFKITDTPYVFNPVIAAEGSVAYIAYETWDANEHRSVQYRRTLNRGATWSAPMPLSPAPMSARSPVLSLQSGVLQALFATGDGLFYTQSSDGIGWSPPERAAGAATFAAFVGFSGHPIVFYEGTYNLYARTRAP